MVIQKRHSFLNTKKNLNDKIFFLLFTSNSKILPNSYVFIGFTKKLCSLSTYKNSYNTILNINNSFNILRYYSLSEI